MSSIIPKVEEPDDKRKMRLLSNKVDELTAKLEQVTEPKRLPEPQADVPQAVQFAANYIAMCQNNFAERSDGLKTKRLDPTTEELIALGSACSLLTDYFDRNNHKLLKQKTEAEKKQREEE